MAERSRFSPDRLDLDERAALYPHPITKSSKYHLIRTLHHPHQRARGPGDFGTPRAAWRDNDRHDPIIALIRTTCDPTSDRDPATFPV
jgi:hypothetical protein